MYYTNQSELDRDIYLAGQMALRRNSQDSRAVTMNNSTFHIVNYWESERGLGTRIDDVQLFGTAQEALAEVKRFNDEAIDKDRSRVPDWYMYATYGGTTKKEEDDK